ncbi:alpha/beta-hydrolase, partial [Violaceomyces palustris]
MYPVLSFHQNRFEGIPLQPLSPPSTNPGSRRKGLASLWKTNGPDFRIKKGAKVKGEPPSWDSSGSKSSSIPPLIIVEGFLSAAQSLVWGDEFKGFMELGEQSFLDQAGAFNDPYGEKLEGEQAWGRGDRLDDDGSIYFAPIGPVSSLHDRACELFYALRGGTVDYGLSHSQEHGHSRYGRHYEEPLCPTWSRHGLPAHFIGHSLGGPTILKLQQLLRKGFFDQALGYERPFAASEGEDGAGEGANEGWRPSDLILSVTSVSSPFRGTPLVYSLGSEPLPYPKVRFLSVGDLLAKAVHLAAFLDLPFFDTHADAWPFARPRTALKAAAESKDEEEAIGCGKHAAFIEASPREGFIGLLRQLWRSDWAEGRDCAPWDCTLFEREKDSQEDDWGLELIEDDDNPEADYSGIMRRRNPRTWYRSYAGYMTRLESAATRDPESLPMHEPTSGWGLSPFILTARLLGSFNFDRVEPSPGFWSAFKQEERGGAAAFPGPSMRAKVESWYCNDGVVPLASQFHPGDCHPSKCRHSTGM